MTSKHEYWTFFNYCMHICILTRHALIISFIFPHNILLFIEMPSFNKLVTTGIAAVFAANTFNMPANAMTKTESNSLSYLQVKGSGLANRCPEVIGEGSIAISGGKKYKITDFCVEPKSWQVTYYLNTYIFIIICLIVCTKLG